MNADDVQKGTVETTHFYAATLGWCGYWTEQAPTAWRIYGVRPFLLRNLRKGMTIQFASEQYTVVDWLYDLSEGGHTQAPFVVTMHIYMKRKEVVRIHVHPTHPDIVR